MVISKQICHYFIDISASQRFMKRFIAAVSVFAMFLNVLPLQAAHAAGPQSAFSLTGFRLPASVTAVFNGAQQEGAGSFQNGLVGAYAEGMCVPMYAEVSNNSSAPAFEMYLNINYDYFRAATGVVGYQGLETYSFNHGITDPNVADNLDDFSFTGADLTSVTSFPLVGGSSVSALVNGPFFGEGDPLVPSNPNRYYHIVLQNVPANAQVLVPFCGRLSEMAGQYSNGADLHISLAEDGRETVSANPRKFTRDAHETASIQGIVYNDADQSLDFNEDPSFLYSGHTVRLYDENYQLIDSMTTGATDSNTNPLFFSGSVVPGQYRFNNLPPAYYYVCAQPPAGAGWTRISPNGVDMDLDANAHSIDPVTSVGIITMTQGFVGNGTEWCYGINMTSVLNQDYMRFGLNYEEPTEPTTATLTIIKQVVGSNEEVGHFSYKLDVNHAPGAVNTVFVDGGTQVELTAGDNYEVRENEAVGYIQTESDDCEGTIVAGQDVTCVITNTYNPTGTITVLKELPNDNGGTEVESDFILYLNGDSVQPGATNTFAPGTFTLSEAWANNHYNNFPNTNSVDEWYDVTYSCVDGNVVTTSPVIVLEDGHDVVCTITNDDIAPEVTVIKHVVGGGPLVASDFDMNVTATNPSLATFPGSETGTVITINPGSFSLDESSVAPEAQDYVADIPDECLNATLGLGDTLTCTITNTYAPLPVDAADGLLQGVLYKDMNGNGTYDEGHPSLPYRVNNVDVTLYDGAFTMVKTMDSGVATADSGPVVKGQYRFRDLEAGTYYVCVQGLDPNVWEQTSPSIGFVDPVLSASTNVSSVADPNSSGQYCYEVELAESQHQLRLRFGAQPATVVVNPGQCVGGELVQNGSFESPVVDPNASRGGTWDNFVDGTVDLFWRVLGLDDSASSGLEVQAGYAGWTPSNGNQFIELDGDEPNIISQELDTVPGVEYTLSFDFSARPETVAANNAVEVFWEGDSLGTITATTDIHGNTDWSQHVFTVTASGETAMLAFADRGATADSLGSFVDNVSVSCGDAPSNQGFLTLVLNVTNDDAGTAQASDYYFNLIDTLATQSVPGDETGLTAPVVGAYTALLVGNMFGYVADTSDPDCGGVMSVGAHLTCTVTLNDVEVVRITEPVTPVLACVEDIGNGYLMAHFGYVNTNAGSVFVQAGTIDNRITGGGFTGDGNHGQPSSFAVGSVPDAFQVSFPGDIPLVWTVVSANESRSTDQADFASPRCQDDEPATATLTVHKIVVNNGGDAIPSDFMLDVTGQNVSIDRGVHVYETVSFPGEELGTVVTLEEGAFEVTEPTVDGYSAQFEGDCEGVAVAGIQYDCIVTNVERGGSEIEGSLTFDVIVDGGDAPASGFNIFMNGGNVTAYHDGDVLPMAPGDYDIFVEPRTGYETTFSGDCTGLFAQNATGNIASDEDALCTITNRFVGGPSGGGSSGNNGGGSGNNGGDGGNGGDNGNGGDGNDNDTSGDRPDPEVLGESDENITNDGTGVGGSEEITPDPIVAGVTDELPRTGVPVAGVLALGSVLAFVSRRRKAE